MSSIYKKGRDGYYYYQTYIFNPESQKKDKRIFHALGTKDLEDAKEKQKELDLKYENQDNIKSYSSELTNKLRPKSTFIVIAATTIITIIIISIVDTMVININKRQSLNFNDAYSIEKNKELKPVESLMASMNDSAITKAEKNLSIAIPKKDSIKLLAVPILPEYNLERVVELPEVFKQVKIFVTLDQNLSNESQKLICDNISKRFSKFSNIIICLYADNDAGINLAKGNDELVSIEEKKQFWLAMYSYNTVEGEYFDDNPSSYLGTY